MALTAIFSQNYFWENENNQDDVLPGGVAVDNIHIKVLLYADNIVILSGYDKYTL